MRNRYAIGETSPYIPFTPPPPVPPGDIPNINWNALATAFLNAGLTIYQTERAIAQEKAKAAAAAASGGYYQYPNGVPGSGGALDANTVMMIAGVGLLAVIMLMKSRT